MKKINKVLKISFITNFFLAIFKIIVGFIGSSSSLIADGIHSFSDLITDIVALVGNSFSFKPADNEHPFGHGKLEYLTCLFVGVVVLLLGLGLIGKAGTNEIIKPSMIVIFASIFTIITKYFLANYLIKKGRIFKNNILISSGKESKADVISSIIVLISSILMQYSDSFNILKYSDMIATIIVGIFIVKTGYMILRDNISMLLGEKENDPILIKKMHETILKYKEIKNIDSFLIMKNGPYYTLTLEVGMSGRISLQKSHDIIENIENDLKNNYDKVKYINIHVNPY